jgi:hypothetical protein
MNDAMGHGRLLSVCRWTARGLSVVSVGIVLLFVIGEGLDFSRFSAHALTLFAFFPFGVCLGQIIAWRKPVLGGSLTIASVAAFYAIHWFSTSRLPNGYAFLLLASPSLLFLLSGLLSLWRDHSDEQL